MRRCPAVAAVVADLDTAAADQSSIGLPSSVRLWHVGGALPGPRRDSFDWMLIAQAIVDNLVIVSNEQSLDAYDVRGLW